jgi:putative transposase
MSVERHAINARTIDDATWQFAQERLLEQLSPEQISGHAAISPETVYQRVYANKRAGRLLRSSITSSSQAAPDRIERHFHASQPNLAWVGDMTFVRTRAGWLYLAILLDLYSRRIVGWAMGDRPNEALTLGALNMALEHRAPKPGLIHHTDQGGIYRSQGYRDRMASVGILPSMGSKGSAYDNAVAESFFSNLKNELIHHAEFSSRENARAAIFSYIELFYNRRRIHQTLGYVSPVAFEEANCEVLN